MATMCIRHNHFQTQCDSKARDNSSQINGWSTTWLERLSSSENFQNTYLMDLMSPNARYYIPHLPPIAGFFPYSSQKHIAPTPFLPVNVLCPTGRGVISHTYYRGKRTGNIAYPAHKPSCNAGNLRPRHLLECISSSRRLCRPNRLASQQAGDRRSQTGLWTTKVAIFPLAGSIERFSAERCK